MLFSQYSIINNKKYSIISEGVEFCLDFDDLHLKSCTKMVLYTIKENVKIKLFIPPNQLIDEILYHIHWRFHFKQIYDNAFEENFQKFYQIKALKFNDLVYFSEKNQIFWPNMQNNFNTSKLQCFFCNGNYMKSDNYKNKLKMFKKNKSEELFLLEDILRNNIMNRSHDLFFKESNETDILPSFFVDLANPFASYKNAHILKQITKRIIMLKSQSEKYFNKNETDLGILLCKKCIVDKSEYECIVPQNFQTVLESIKEIHEKKQHIIGSDRIFYEMITEKRLTCPNLKKVINEFLHDCQICTRGKIIIRKTIKKATITYFPMDLLIMDLYELPDNFHQKYKYVMFICDHFSKFIWDYCLENKNGEEIEKKLLKLLNTERPLCILTDNGKEFVNQRMITILESKKIIFRHGKPCRPQVQGLVEKMNSLFTDYLNKFILLNPQYEKNFNIKEFTHKFTYDYNHTFNLLLKKKPIEVKNLHNDNDFASIRKNILIKKAKIANKLLCLLLSDNHIKLYEEETIPLMKELSAESINYVAVKDIDHLLDKEQENEKEKCESIMCSEGEIQNENDLIEKREEKNENLHISMLLPISQHGIEFEKKHEEVILGDQIYVLNDIKKIGKNTKHIKRYKNFRKKAVYLFEAVITGLFNTDECQIQFLNDNAELNIDKNKKYLRNII